MKTTLLLAAALLAGCTEVQPPPPRTVVVVQIPVLPRVTGQIVEVIQVGEDKEPIHTWMTGEEVKAAKKERLIKEHPECDCQPGDPLCSCIE